MVVSFAEGHAISEQNGGTGGSIEMFLLSHIAYIYLSSRGCKCSFV